MKLTPVESSNIAAVGYLEDEQVLLVRYHDGGLYAYCGWTAEMYIGLLAAESKGKFLSVTGRTGIAIAKKLEVPYVTGQNVGGTDSPPTQSPFPSVTIKDDYGVFDEIARKSKLQRPDCSFGVIPK